MAKQYPLSYRSFYDKLSAATGMSNEEADQFLLKIINILANDLHRNGTVYLPYLGRFSLKRMSPMKRSVMDFGKNQRVTIDVPAEDKLKFNINKRFKKLFK